MGSDRRKHFLIACRYVPYDQWFITNISSSWKIKHVKQSIIAKAFGLPFDRRLLIQDSSTARSPSPITFAPTEDTLRDNDFSSALADVEATDKTQAQGSEGQLFANDINPSASNPDRHGRASPFVEPAFVEEKDQIYTGVFTLIRFSTGQILQGNFFVSWYNLEPHELVELHCSSPPTTFARALVFSHMLVNGGSFTVDVPTSSGSDSYMASESNLDRHPSNPLLSSMVPPGSTTATLSLSVADPPRFAALPRHDIASYTEPYWEGWVRVLCIMRRPDVDRSQKQHFRETISSSGAGFPFEENLPDSGHRWKADNRWTKVKEWRERWAVIRNGVLRLSKNRDDAMCTRLPLSALVSLCGPEYFSFGHSDQTPMNIHGGGSGSDDYKRPAISHQNLAPTVRAYRSASVSDPSRVTTPVEIDSVGVGKFLLTATSSNSLTSPRVLSRLTTQTNATRAMANANSPLLTTPIDPIHNYSSPMLPIDPERSRRERAAVRELGQERMQKEIAKGARLDRQIEPMMRWEGVFGGRSKAKSRGKEKDRGRSGKDREEKQQKTKRSAGMGSGSLIGEGGTEMDNHERQHEKDGEKVHPFVYPDDRYIPASREEAIAKGMLVVCAKFRISIVEDMGKARNKEKSCVREVGLDVSVTRSEEGERRDHLLQEDQRWLERNAEWQVSESPFGITSLSPPGKASLPGRGLTKLSSGGNIAPGGTIFGGFFGNKEKDTIDTDGFDSEDDDRQVNHEAGVHAPMFSPYTADDRRVDESMQDDGRGYRLTGYGPDDECAEQQATKEEKGAKSKEDRIEWVVLDMGTETAHNNFLRILHRHFPPPIQSSFVHRSAAPFQPSHDNAPRHGVHGAPLAVPYPEWRRDVVFRARSQGMRELGRPLEHALYKLETAKAPQKRKYSDYQIPSTTRKDDLSDTDHGSDTDLGDHHNALELHTLILDDSDEESEDEAARWWQDIPRQHSEKQDIEWSTGTEDNPSSIMRFTDPFAFSPSRSDSSEPGSITVSAQSMEERLRPSISSSTLASNTSSSMSGVTWQNSPESYQFRSYPRRVVSPSQTLSSPSSNESLGSFPYHRFSPRPFSPNSDFYLPNAYRPPSDSPSALHHSASMPNASALRSTPSAGGGIRRERTITAPAFKSTLTLAQIDDVQSTSIPHDDPLSEIDSFASIGVHGKPILTPDQIRKIETETEARIDDDYAGLTHGISSFGTNTEDGTTQRNVSTPMIDNFLTPVLRRERLTNEGREGSRNAGQDSGALTPFNAGEFESSSSAWKTMTRRTMNTGTLPSPSSYQAPESEDSASDSAKAILRRVRSGSSLQPPLEVHFEEYEEYGLGV